MYLTLYTSSCSHGHAQHPACTCTAGSIECSQFTWIRCMLVAYIVHNTDVWQMSSATHILRIVHINTFSLEVSCLRCMVCVDHTPFNKNRYVCRGFPIARNLPYNIIMYIMYMYQPAMCACICVLTSSCEAETLLSPPPPYSPSWLLLFTLSSTGLDVFLSFTVKSRHIARGQCTVLWLWRGGWVFARDTSHFVTIIVIAHPPKKT